MVDDNANIALGFIPCPKCGELIQSDSAHCRFCGQSVTGAINASSSIQPESSSSGELTKISVGRKKMFPSCEPAFTPDGLSIPPEYTRNFKSNTYCWSALWFADLWHAEKGLRPEAIRHFALRMAATLFGVTSIVMFFQTAEAAENANVLTIIQMGLGFIAFLLSMMVVFAVLLMSHMDAMSAHYKYLHAYNSRLKNNDVPRTKTSSERLYWLLLWAPFIIFMILFLISLARETSG